LFAHPSAPYLAPDHGSGQARASTFTATRSRSLWAGRAANNDKGEGRLDKAKGKAKEAAGALSGDETKKSERRSDQTKGTVKEKVGKAKDLLK
jgi:uncharacterized protein YjbJ (UPF0337 family)